MNYKVAKITLSSFEDREFDYAIPKGMQYEQGQRVLVDFRGKKTVGIITSLAKTSNFPTLKPIIDILDEKPLLGPEQMEFAHALSKLYPYPYQTFLFMMLPALLKKNKKINTAIAGEPVMHTVSQKIFIQGNNFRQRYDLWKENVRDALQKGSVLICFPQRTYLDEAYEIIKKDFPQQLKIFHSYEKETELLKTWVNTRAHALILGTRIALFYYPNDLNLLILEEENNPYYFQEEKPYYHLLDAAFILQKLKKINLILSADFPSLKTYHCIKDNTIVLQEKAEERKEIRVIGVGEYKKSRTLSPLVSELLRRNIAEKKKTLVLWNKKNFARMIMCSACGYTYTCPRCSGFLHLAAMQNSGICPYCNYRQALPNICPKCQKGYLKGAGVGIEKLLTVMKREFPDAKINMLEAEEPDSQIILSTLKILSAPPDAFKFPAGILLDSDMLFSRPEYDATFSTFLQIKKLSRYFSETLYVCTRNNEHYLFTHLNDDWHLFYERELKLREELHLPPFGSIAKITIRGKDENKLCNAANDLYNRLQKHNLEIYGPFTEQPFKLRGKFRYSLIVKSKVAQHVQEIVKKEIDAKRSRFQYALVIK
jgi:primosomal protein N' (replication factor Y)